MNQVIQKANSPKSALGVFSNLVHALQLERGCTALYLDSKGALFTEEITQRHQETDRTLAAAKRMHGHWKSEALDDGTQTRIANMLQKIEQQLPERRQRILSLALSFSEAVNVYTHQFHRPILDIMVEIALFAPGADTVKVSAYNKFLQWKERVGRERTWGAHGFYVRSFNNREFVEHMLSLVEDQEAYASAFQTLASENQRAIVNMALGGKGDAVVSRVHAFLAKYEAGAKLDKVEPVEWFNIITGKIDRMKKAEQKLVETLAAEATPPGVLPSDIFPPLPPSDKNQLRQHMPLIHSLPIFSQLSLTSRNALLAHGEVRRYGKGKLLFLQSEHVSRYYIILSGWVKLFNGTEEGDEATLQMLTSGDSLMDAAVFLDAPAPASAQVVEDAVLLSLPAPIIRQHVRENNELAVSMLASMSLRSENLIRQIEQSRLRTATERVGWFLLKLQLESGGPDRSTVSLPYEKSLVASYLDMMPETLSRTLKRFRGLGFEIENNQIHIPNPGALCDFCDRSLIPICQIKNTPDCPKVQGGQT